MGGVGYQQPIKKNIFITKLTSLNNLTLPILKLKIGCKLDTQNDEDRLRSILNFLSVTMFGCDKSRFHKETYYSENEQQYCASVGIIINLEVAHGDRRYFSLVSYTNDGFNYVQNQMFSNLNLNQGKWFSDFLDVEIGIGMTVLKFHIENYLKRYSMITNEYRLSKRPPIQPAFVPYKGIPNNIIVDKPDKDTLIVVLTNADEDEELLDPLIMCYFLNKSLSYKKPKDDDFYVSTYDTFYEQNKLYYLTKPQIVVNTRNICFYRKRYVGGDFEQLILAPHSKSKYVFVDTKNTVIEEHKKKVYIGGYCLNKTTDNMLTLIVNKEEIKAGFNDVLTQGEVDFLLHSHFIGVNWDTYEGQQISFDD